MVADLEQVRETGEQKELRATGPDLAGAAERTAKPALDILAAAVGGEHGEHLEARKVVLLVRSGLVELPVGLELLFERRPAVGRALNRLRRTVEFDEVVLPAGNGEPVRSDGERLVERPGLRRPLDLHVLEVVAGLERRRGEPLDVELLGLCRSLKHDRDLGDADGMLEGDEGVVRSSKTISPTLGLVTVEGEVPVITEGVDGVAGVELAGETVRELDGGLVKVTGLEEPLQASLHHANRARLALSGRPEGGDVAELRRRRQAMRVEEAEHVEIPRLQLNRGSLGRITRSLVFPMAVSSSGSVLEACQDPFC